MTIFKSAIGLTIWTMAAFIGTAHAAEPYLAEIRTFAQHECPGGWVPTDGRLLQTGHYRALESILRDRFGSTSRNDFAVPKLPPPESTDGTPQIQCISANGIPPSHYAYVTEHFIGEIRLFATSACPMDWIPTTGGYFHREYVYGLSAVIGNRYGGHGNLIRMPYNPPVFAEGNRRIYECIASVGIFPH